MKNVLLLFLIFASCVGYGQTIHTIGSGSEIYYPAGSPDLSACKGGDTLRILAGHYASIIINKFSGNAAHPLVIVNYGGQVVANYFRIDSAAHYFKIIGIGGSYGSYGFKIGVPGAPYGLSIGLADHYEVAWLDVGNGADVGLYFKHNPVDASTTYPAFLIDGVKIHDCYSHHTVNEAMYIGHTYPNGDPYSNNLIPVRMANVEIWNNRTDSSGWDGIQLSNATMGCSIHDNIVTNYGMAKVGGQQAGIIFGANTTGDVYRNYVIGGSGNGVQVFGYGTIHIYNNEFDGCGADLSYNNIGQESIYVDDRISMVENRHGMSVYVDNNMLVNPPVNPARGLVRIADYNNTIVAGYIRGTQVCTQYQFSPGWDTNQTFFIIGAQVPLQVKQGQFASCNNLVRQTPVAPSIIPLMAMLGSALVDNSSGVNVHP